MLIYLFSKTRHQVEEEWRVPGLVRKLNSSNCDQTRFKENYSEVELWLTSSGSPPSAGCGPGGTPPTPLTRWRWTCCPTRHGQHRKTDPHPRRHSGEQTPMSHTNTIAKKQHQ